MSTELKKPCETISATRFWGGGERGSCVQLTQSHSDGHHWLKITRDEALAVSLALHAFAHGLEEEE